jgi:hypothetical protein
VLGAFIRTAGRIRCAAGGGGGVVKGFRRVVGRITGVPDRLGRVVGPIHRAADGFHRVDKSSAGAVTGIGREVTKPLRWVVSRDGAVENGLPSKNFITAMARQCFSHGTKSSCKPDWAGSGV